jgi:hypothetical protein
VVLELGEALSPHSSVGLEPSVELDERLGAEAVEATLAVRANRDQSCLTKYAQVLRDRRLADSKLLN